MLSPNTVDGHRGEYWEFLVNDDGVPVHSVDEFIIGPDQLGYGILTQAPAQQYASLSQEFGTVRGTLSLFPGTVQ